MGAPRWQDNKTLLHAWLLIFFPVGLYALWTGPFYEKQIRWSITGGVVVMFLVLGRSYDALLALILAPMAVFILWKDPDIQRPTVYKFAAAAGVIFLLFLAAPAPQGGDSYSDGSGIFQGGNCTYYRDSNNNVIGRSCD